MKAEIKYPNKHRSDSIVAWLNAHQLISRSALANLAGYDPDNFRKAFDGARSIPATYLDEFEMELAKYGYKKPI